MSYTEADIKYEGRAFFVVYNCARDRHEVCKHGVTHATVVGCGDLDGAIRTAKKLELYPERAGL